MAKSNANCVGTFETLVRLVMLRVVHSDALWTVIRVCFSKVYNSTFTIIMSLGV